MNMADLAAVSCFDVADSPQQPPPLMPPSLARQANHVVPLCLRLQRCFSVLGVAHLKQPEPLNLLSSEATQTWDLLPWCQGSYTQV